MIDRIEHEAHEPLHHPDCQWETRRNPCRQYSTDGTLLGARIAHTMGTTDEKEIARRFALSRTGDDMGSQIDGPQLCGMEDEQADWESDEIHTEYSPTGYSMTEGIILKWTK